LVAGPSSVAEVLSGTVGRLPDPLRDALLSAAGEAVQGVDTPTLAARFGAPGTDARTIRDSLVTLAALPELVPLYSWPVSIIERATILIYEWMGEFHRARSSKNKNQPRDHLSSVSEARDAQATLLREDEDLAAERPRLTKNARAMILAERHGTTADAVRAKLRRARSPRR
jgi:hypothetical protein